MGAKKGDWKLKKKRGIITFEEMQKKYDEMKYDYILKDAKEKRIIWKGDGKDTRWKFRNSENKIVARKEEKDIDEAYLEFYCSTSEKKQIITFELLYFEWVENRRQYAGTKKGQLSVSTIRRYERDYERYIQKTKFSKKDITKINAIDLENLLMNIAETHELTKSSIDNIAGYIRNAFKYARKMRYVEYNITYDVDMKLVRTKCVEKAQNDEDRVLSTEEMQYLLEAIREHEEKRFYIQDYAIELAMLTGMRVGEIAALRWSSITKDYIIIKESEHRLDYADKTCEYIISHTKNGKIRRFPITKEIRALLARIRSVLAEKNISDDFIFSDKKGRVNSHTISCAINRRCEEAGINKKSIHAIRRTVSSNLRKTLPISTVANLLGHLEKTNEEYYNYDVVDINTKITHIESLHKSFVA